MRDKHLNNTHDKELLSIIYKAVNEQLRVNTSAFYVLIWSKFIFYISLYGLAYFFIYSIENPLIFCINNIFYGISSVLLALNFSHDFAHNTIFKNRKLNNFCYSVLFTIVGAHAEAWKQRHVQEHHYAPNVHGFDPDLKLTKLIRIIPNSEYLWFHTYQHFYAPIAYTTYSLFWIFIKDFVFLYAKDEYVEKKNLFYHLSFWTQKAVYLSITLILPLLFSVQKSAIILIGFLVMHVFQSVFLLFTFFMTHHVEATEYPTIDENGNISTSWFKNQILSSNDIHPFSSIANFILGGFNNHIAHHLFPHIHHIHYPNINKILYTILNQNNIIPNQTSYWGGILSHLKVLKYRSYAEN